MTDVASTLISRVAHAIRRENLFSPGDTLVVAISGGADSTALLDMLTRLPGFDLHLLSFRQKPLTRHSSGTLRDKVASSGLNSELDGLRLLTLHPEYSPSSRLDPL